MFEERSYCGELDESFDGKFVKIAGWVNGRRDLGGVIFLEIRDVTGIIQVVFDSSDSIENAEKAENTRNEYVVFITGDVRKRSEETINPELAAGRIEIVAKSIEVLNRSEVPPIQIDTRDQLSEEIRLKYRFLDLRREEVKNTFILRHKVMQETRNYLSANRFLEIETPMLNKSTPEGARDFLVPSRINRGEFYALPQSPQLFKQILMISGFDKYFQIVKCFRDEDLRNDRQPEFTQIDLELSFVTVDMIIEATEGLLQRIMRAVDKDITLPVPRMTYTEAMTRFGTDAPDVRFGLELVECSDIFIDSEFNVFKSAIKKGGVVKGICVEDDGKISRKMIDDYTDHVKIYGAKGFPMFKYNSGKFEGGISKFLSEDEKSNIIKRFNLDKPAVLFFSVDSEAIVNFTLANMRKKIAEDLNLIDTSKFNFVWITDFPLFDYNIEEKRFDSTHHPFTAPLVEQADKLDELTPENFSEFKSQAYDIVLNGVEIGGGSLRINDPVLQGKIFSLLGISEEEAREKFSFLLDALKYGAPPHGGIALGLDRIMMLLLGKNSIRDVMAFPKTQKGQCLLSNAPSKVSKVQLRDLALKVVERKV
jgi:aspartyl-tRNA synthetase